MKNMTDEEVTEIIEKLVEEGWLVGEGPEGYNLSPKGRVLSYFLGREQKAIQMFLSKKKTKDDNDISVG